MSQWIHHCLATLQKRKSILLFQNKIFYFKFIQLFLKVPHSFLSEQVCGMKARVLHSKVFTLSFAHDDISRNFYVERNILCLIILPPELHMPHIINALLWFDSIAINDMKSFRIVNYKRLHQGTKAMAIGYVYLLWLCCWCDDFCNKCHTTGEIAVFFFSQIITQLQH